MIWFGFITMTLIAVWMLVIAFDTDKNIKQEKADKNIKQEKADKEEPKKSKIKL